MRCAGLSLIEMLIALLVISVGLLGLAGLQAVSLRQNTSAYQRSQANTLAYNILDCLRANRSAALSEGYNISLTTPAAAGSDRVSRDLADWKALLAEQLPAGDGEIQCDDATAICRITVAWDDGRTGQVNQYFVVSTRL